MHTIRAVRGRVCNRLHARATVAAAPEAHAARCVRDAASAAAVRATALIAALIALIIQVVYAGAHYLCWRSSRAGVQRQYYGAQSAQFAEDPVVQTILSRRFSHADALTHFVRFALAIAGEDSVNFLIGFLAQNSDCRIAQNGFFSECL